MDRDAAIKSALSYAGKVRQIFNPTNIVLYGSYANGVPNEYSDIDIAVVFDGYTGNWLEDSSLLWKLTTDTNISIEPILLDIANDESGFVKEILKTGIVV